MPFLWTFKKDAPNSWLTFNLIWKALVCVFCSVFVFVFIFDLIWFMLDLHNFIGQDAKVLVVQILSHIWTICSCSGVFMNIFDQRKIFTYVCRMFNFSLFLHISQGDKYWSILPFVCISASGCVWVRPQTFRCLLGVSFQMSCRMTYHMLWHGGCQVSVTSDSKLNVKKDFKSYQIFCLMFYPISWYFRCYDQFTAITKIIRCYAWYNVLWCWHCQVKFLIQMHILCQVINCVKLLSIIMSDIIFNI